MPFFALFMIVLNASAAIERVPYQYVYYDSRAHVEIHDRIGCQSLLVDPKGSAAGANEIVVGAAHIYSERREDFGQDLIDLLRKENFRRFDDRTVYLGIRDAQGKIIAGLAVTFVFYNRRTPGEVPFEFVLKTKPVPRIYTADGEGVFVEFRYYFAEKRENARVLADLHMAAMGVVSRRLDPYPQLMDEPIVHTFGSDISLEFYRTMGFKETIVEFLEPTFENMNTVMVATPHELKKYALTRHFNRIDAVKRPGIDLNLKIGPQVVYCAKGSDIAHYFTDGRETLIVAENQQPKRMPSKDFVDGGVILDPARDVCYRSTLAGPSGGDTLDEQVWKFRGTFVRIPKGTYVSRYDNGNLAMIVNHEDPIELHSGAKVSAITFYENGQIAELAGFKKPFLLRTNAGSYDLKFATAVIFNQAEQIGHVGFRGIDGDEFWNGQTEQYLNLPSIADPGQLIPPRSPLRL